MSQEVINTFIDKGYLLSPDFVKELSDNFDSGSFLKSLKKYVGEGLCVLNKDLLNSLTNIKVKLDINWVEFEKSKSKIEKGMDSKTYETFLNLISYNVYEEKKALMDEILVQVKKEEGLVVEDESSGGSSVIVLKNYKEDAKKRDVQDFVKYFRKRYETMKCFLENRVEMQNIISINKVSRKSNNEPASLIGLVVDKRTTKNSNIILTLEDLSGRIDLLIKKDSEVYDLVGGVVLDECIGINGFVGNNIIYVKQIFFPDIPLINELKKCADEAYAVFIGDLHIGSNAFLLEDFTRFLKWLKGGFGNNKQRGIAKKIRYLFIVGDIVEGVGIYPDQEKDLKINDIYKQYEECASLLGQIPSRIKIIICGGNHDALRISEPQPCLYKDLSKPLWELSNVVMVSNPGFVNIHASKDFLGFNVLIYHGFSFTYYASEVEKIRLSGGLERVDLILTLLLQKRHLAPSHSSTLYIPGVEEDPLVIDKVPDFFVSGHIHKAVSVNYKNVDAFSCSCWIGQTDYQEWRGIHPDPSKAFVVNLKTREIKIMNFSK